MTARDCERFLGKLGVLSDEECWPWLAGRNRGLYGSFSLNGKKRTATHIAYEWHWGPIPPDKPYICHQCDTPDCCNPLHLKAGTQADNMREASLRGRCAQGARHPQAKLT